MRIALLTHQFPSVRLGGIGAYTLNAAKLLASANHDVHIFTLPLPEDVLAVIPKNITIHQVPTLADRIDNNSVPGILAAALHTGGPALYRLALAAHLCDAVRKVHTQKNFDILEAPEYEALALPLLLSPIENLPVITHLHSGSAVLRQTTNLEPTAEQLLIEALEAGSILAADALCAPSRHIIADTAKSCPTGHVEVLPLPFFDEIKALYSDPPDPKIAPILYIGRLEQIKGAHLIPETLNIFLDKHPAARIRLVGPDTNTAPDNSGSMANYIRKNLNPIHLPKVSFLGEQTKSQLSAELHNAAFLILPSLVESFSYVACEAMAASRPIILSAGIGATDVVADAGLTFDRGDSLDLAEKMHHLFENADLQKQLSQAAFSRIQTVLGLTSTLAKREAFYTQTISNFKSQNRRSPSESIARLPQRYAAPLLQSLAQLTTVLAGTPDPTIQTPGTRLLKIMNSIQQQTKIPAQIILYGAGRHTTRLLSEKHLWESQGHKILGLIDDHPRFQSNPTYHNLPVQSLTQFANNPTANAHVVLSTDAFQDQFWQQTAALREKQIPVHKLYN